MVLIKEIELALKPESNEVRAQEDEILADSVLELANTDFSKVDSYEDNTPGTIRKHVEADMRVAYPGKPTSRKKIFKDRLKADLDIKEKVGRSSLSDQAFENSDESELSEEESIQEDDGTSSNGNNSQIEAESEIESGDSDGDDSDYDGSILGHDSSDEVSGEVKTGVEEEEQEQGTSDEEPSDNKGIEVFSSRAKDIEGDIAKGKSIKNQLSIWERLIESRIKLQPSLISANKLYKKESFEEFKNSLNQEEEEVIMQTYSSLSELMKGLLLLQENLLKASPDYREHKQLKRKKSSDDDSEINDNDCQKKKIRNDFLKDIEQEFKPFRNSIIQKWNEKTRVTSGKINKNDFSAFDQPTLKQIEEILLDRDRLIKRTQTKRSDYTTLGKKIEATADDTTEGTKRKNQGECDPEIFDDDDFYHKLLRDFIEKKTSDVTDVSKRGKQWLELQKLRSKMKAKVDTRASKGRKIRFTVHNKMVNYMAPVPCHIWSEEAKNELFKSLFC